MRSFPDVVRANRAWMCLDCGKCSSVCPIAIHQVGGYTSPRLLVERALSAGEGAVRDDPLLWSCLTCGRCTEICPSRVEFSALIQQTRQLVRQEGLTADCTHSGVVQSWGKMMAQPDRVQQRLAWISPGLRVSGQSDTLYWAGCLPYYQEAFAALGIESLEIAVSALKILNHLGIEPILLDQERCCGHDQYWQGDLATFRKLAEINLDLIGRSGARRIVTTCPECAYTLKHTYQAEVAHHGLEVLHLVELLDQAGFSLPGGSGTEVAESAATYQDPCRLGRLAGIYQQPRELIRRAGIRLVEMDHNRESSICCGTSCWSSCGRANQQIQAERLREAGATGAATLITSCIKCQIHLKCAQKTAPADAPRLEIRDLTTLLAEAI